MVYNAEQIISNAQNTIRHINELLEKAGSDVRFATELIKAPDVDSYSANIPMA